MRSNFFAAIMCGLIFTLAPSTFAQRGAPPAPAPDAPPDPIKKVVQGYYVFALKN
jgi:hypothetical protein